MPPAHVGLHAGPVIFQDGDYFGQTVNIASRIAEYARPGRGAGQRGGRDRLHRVPAIDYREIGPVELKGVSGALRLYSAHFAV